MKPNHFDGNPQAELTDFDKLCVIFDNLPQSDSRAVRRIDIRRFLSLLGEDTLDLLWRDLEASFDTSFVWKIVGQIYLEAERPEA